MQVSAAPGCRSKGRGGTGLQVDTPAVGMQVEAPRWAGGNLMVAAATENASSLELI
jgi:hypothetical protein